MQRADTRRAAWAQFDRADTRALGVFRIYFGCVLLVELACLWPHRVALYTDAGVLSTAFLAQQPQVAYQTSAFFLCHTQAQAELGFALVALVLIAYVLGLWTKLVQVLLIACVISLHARNLFLETGAAIVVHLLAVLTVFLPLGERYSLDAWRARRRAPPAAVRSVASAVAAPAMIAVRVQCAVIYALSALHKLTPQWINGSAIHYVLWQNRTATPLAAWLRMHEPAWFSPLASWSSVLIELLIAALILWPREQRRTRLLALGLAITLHASIAALMNLGAFSWVMIALVLSAVRPDPDAVRAVIGNAPALRGGALVPSVARGWRRYGVALEKGAVALLAVMLISSLLVDDPWLRRLGVRPPAAWLAPASALRLRQGWTMYSSVPEQDGMIVVDALTQTGRHIDPFTGRAPDWNAPLLAPVLHAEPITSYLVGVVTPGGSAYLGELRRYLRSFRASGDTIRSFQIWWVGQQAPPPGTTQPCCRTRTRI